MHLHFFQVLLARKMVQLNRDAPLGHPIFSIIEQFLYYMPACSMSISQLQKDGALNPPPTRVRLSLIYPWHQALHM